jgi:hypothetical protein
MDDDFNSSDIELDGPTAADRFANAGARSVEAILAQATELS